MAPFPNAPLRFKPRRHNKQPEVLPTAYAPTVVCTAYTTSGFSPPSSESRQKTASRISSMQIAVSIALISFILCYMTVRSVPPYAFIRNAQERQPMEP